MGIGWHRTTNCEWAQLGSNQRPSGYEPPALTAELWALAKRIVPYLIPDEKRENLAICYL
jgi:hypothetical protein